MSEREVTIRTAVVTYFPMFIAVLSLVTSIYNGYLNGKFVDIIQRNFGPNICALVKRSLTPTFKSSSGPASSAKAPTATARVE